MEKTRYSIQFTADDEKKANKLYGSPPNGFDSWQSWIESRPENSPRDFSSLEEFSDDFSEKFQDHEIFNFKRVLIEQYLKRSSNLLNFFNDEHFNLENDGEIKLLLLKGVKFVRLLEMTPEAERYLYENPDLHSIIVKWLSEM
ncbi:MAG: hypothetical protein ACFFCS_19120 [Candidatus Hodarchaeota archaeon]